MNIDELPNGLRELAEKRKFEYNPTRGDDTFLVDSFTWSVTKEGWDFWSDVSKGNFDVYNQKYPYHQWIKDYPDEYEIGYDHVKYEYVVVSNPAHRIHEEAAPPSDEGIKEDNGKLSYEEIDFEFIDLMAANMSKNKDKYPPFNWHKPINKMKLVDAILRHTRKVKQPIEGDIETAEEHLVSIACDAMMLFYQYKHYK